MHIPTIAQTDRELLPWLLGIQGGRPQPAGDFLRYLAEAALRADFANYASLRPALIEIRTRHPEYHDPIELDYRPETFGLEAESQAEED